MDATREQLRLATLGAKEDHATIRRLQRVNAALLKALEDAAHQLHKVQFRGYHNAGSWRDAGDLAVFGSLEEADAAVERQARLAIKAAS